MPKKILIVVGHYLPGFNSGGILRSVVNTIDHLSDEFEFFVLTRDHDLGVSDAYKNIQNGEWQEVGNGNVYYLDKKATSFSKLCMLINSTSCDCIQLNSFFDTLSIKINLAMKFGFLKKKPLLISPRGEFAKASFDIKLFKKTLFVKIVKFLDFYSGSYWHVSSDLEQIDLIDKMSVEDSKVIVAKDLPVKINTFDSFFTKKDFYEDTLKIIFLSRISLEKNLDLAIKILSNVNTSVIFDIYGTIENKKYWNKCMNLAKKLPNNIKLNYMGIVDADKVTSVFSKYDLFLFPTGGENYGHVIAESISAGTKVLLSKKTPWQNLEAENLGWNFDLDDVNSFVNVINEMSKENISQRITQKKFVIKASSALLSNPALLDENRIMYRNLITS